MNELSIRLWLNNLKNNFMETYIVNGRYFKTYDEVIAYCEENNYRVTNTETIKKRLHLITVTSIN